MKKWHLPLGRWSRNEIDEAVGSPLWQTFRLSLQGMSTEKKLDELARYLRERTVINWQTKCQVDNYINALKRGGLLDSEGRVVR